MSVLYVINIGLIVYTVHNMTKSLEKFKNCTSDLFNLAIHDNENYKVSSYFDLKTFKTFSFTI